MWREYPHLPAAMSNLLQVLSLWTRALVLVNILVKDTSLSVGWAANSVGQILLKTFLKFTCPTDFCIIAAIFSMKKKIDFC